MGMGMGGRLVNERESRPMKIEAIGGEGRGSSNKLGGGFCGGESLGGNGGDLASAGEASRPANRRSPLGEEERGVMFRERGRSRGRREKEKRRSSEQSGRGEQKKNGVVGVTVASRTCSSSGMRRSKRRERFGMVWFGLVWFGLEGTLGRQDQWFFS